jgi:hypothetical protein
LESPALFAQMDPHLRQLHRQRLVYRFPILDHLPCDTPGVYSITGGRQIGKTTVLKQWMAEMLRIVGVPVEPLPLALLRMGPSPVTADCV